MSKRKKKLKTENNPSVHKKIQSREGQWNCKVCPPWEGENSVGRKYSKHGPKKRKKKDHRK